MIPYSLLGKLKGEKGEGAAPLSIRRFEDVRFETANEKRSKKAKREDLQKRSTRMIMRDGLMVPETNYITIKAEDDGKDPISGKESWMMSTSALLGVVAELWTEVLTDARTAEARAGLRKLDVAAVLWERLLHKHAVKSVAQRALADLTSSLKAEAAWDGCMGRLRLAAEMISLGRRRSLVGGEVSLLLGVTSMRAAERMKQHLLDVELHLPMSIVVQLCSLAVRNRRSATYCSSGYRRRRSRTTC